MRCFLACLLVLFVVGVGLRFEFHAKCFLCLLILFLFASLCRFAEVDM